MSGKVILVTGSTDGIGFEAAKKLVALGHTVLLHGRNRDKLAAAEQSLTATAGGGRVECFTADLSRLAEVESLATAVAARHDRLDALVNNAGVYKAPNTRTPDDLDVRFAVNAIAPYLLTRRLLPIIDRGGRVINLSSAAQSSVDLDALLGRSTLSDNAAYAQSKLTITIWSRALAMALGNDGPVVLAVNPGSLLATKMVKEAFGIAGADLSIGAEIIVRAILSDEFKAATGQYFDNDSGRIGSPHPDALDPAASSSVVEAIEAILSESASRRQGT